MSTTALLLGGPKDGDILSVRDDYAVQVAAYNRGLVSRDFLVEHATPLTAMTFSTITYNLTQVALFGRRITVGIEGYPEDERLARGLLRDHAFDIWRDAR